LKSQKLAYEAIRATGDAVIIAESVEHEISLGFDSRNVKKFWKIVFEFFSIEIETHTHTEFIFFLEKKRKYS